MRSLVATLLVALLWPITITAQVPSLSPFDLKNLKGKEASKIIETKIKECQAMATYLADLIQKSPQGSDILSQALDLFQGVIYQLNKLKGDLSAPPGSLSITLPPIPPSPPYPLDLYKKLLNVYSSIAQQLEAANLSAKLLKEELDTLESEIKDLTAQWLALKEKSPPPPDYYLVLAQLINSQAQYVSKNLKLSHVTGKIQALSSLQTQTDKLLKKVFFHLKLGAKDLKEAQANANEKEAALEKIRAQVRRELTRLNRLAALLEVKKRRIIQKLQTPKLKPQEKKILQMEKERLEVLQEEIQLKRKKASQKERKALLDFAEASFQLQWIKCYMKVCTRKERIQNLELWKKRLTRIRNYLESTKIEFNRIQATSEIINSKLIALEQITPPPQEKEAIQSLTEAYRRMLNTINSLAQTYQENIGKCKNLILEMGYTLNLLKRRAGGLDRLYAWFTENRKAITKRVKTVLYYPIITLGETPFTLATILEFFLILTIGILVVRLLRRKAYKILTERFAMSPGSVNSLTTLIYYVLILVVFLIALSGVGVNLKQVTIIFGALGVGIGFGLQTIANNFVSGIILLTERSIEAGDIVELEDGTTGEVRRISIRSTVIRTYDGLDIIVPNSELVSGRVTTWTYQDDWRRLRIPFGVAYGTDPQKVAQIAREAALSVPSTIEDAFHPIQVWFEGFGDSSLDFVLVVWIRMHHLKSKTGLRSDYYYALYRKLTEAGIEIPFPQQDIHIRNIYPEAAEALKGIKEEKETPPEGS